QPPAVQIAGRTDAAAVLAACGDGSPIRSNADAFRRRRYIARVPVAVLSTRRKAPAVQVARRLNAARVLAARGDRAPRGRTDLLGDQRRARSSVPELTPVVRAPA